MNLLYKTSVVKTSRKILVIKITVQKYQNKQQQKT